MKVILYMGISANGYVAKENDDTTSWISEVEWTAFRNFSNKVGNLIIGRKTFDVAIAENQFPFTESFTVVVTSKDIKNNWPNSAAFVKSPKEALELLQKMGHKQAMVGGGGEINTSFIKQSLVDEIYLDIEPHILGRGIKLFAEADFETKLELIGTKKLSANEIQLHYKVLK